MCGVRQGIFSWPVGCADVQFSVSSEGVSAAEGEVKTAASVGVTGAVGQPIRF
jgi:hypothetical protein